MLFDSTLKRDLGRNFGITLLILLTLVMTVLLIRTLGQAAGGAIAPQDVLLLLGYAGLSYLPIMLALSLFIAVVVTLGRMYRESEMAIWFSSGIGLTRFIRPVLGMSLPLLLLILALEVWVWPWCQVNSLQMKERFDKRSDLSRVAPGQFQSSRDGSRVFFIERDAQQDTIGRNVFILTDSETSESVTTAGRGEVMWDDDARYLVLSHGQRNEFHKEAGDKTLARFTAYRMMLDQQPARTEGDLPPKARSTWELFQMPSRQAQGELVWRFGMALGAVNLVLMGISLSASNPRQANSWNLLFALLAFIVYYQLIVLSQSWVANGKYSVAVSMGAVHGGGFALAIGLMLWRDYRIALPRWSWRSAPAVRTEAA